MEPEQPLNNIPTSTLIHVGIELAVIAGLSYWQHTKNATLQTQIEVLSKKVEDFENLPRMIKPLTLDELKLFFGKKPKNSRKNP